MLLNILPRRTATGVQQLTGGRRQLSSPSTCKRKGPFQPQQHSHGYNHVAPLSPPIHPVGLSCLISLLCLHATMRLHATLRLPQVHTRMSCSGAIICMSLMRWNLVVRASKPLLSTCPGLRMHGSSLILRSIHAEAAGDSIFHGISPAVNTKAAFSVCRHAWSGMCCSKSRTPALWLRMVHPGTRRDYHVVG